VSSGRGDAGWRLVWARWRSQVVGDRDPEGLLWLLDTAQMVGDAGDVDRIVAPFRGVTVEPDLAVDIADALIGLGRHGQAWAFLAPHVDGGDRDVLERAAVAAEQQGRLMEAARYLEKVLATDEPMPLSELRAVYGRVLSLYGRLALAPSSEGLDALEAMLGAAAAWRRHDPDNVGIDRLCAATLFAVDREDEAWRHLSTAIERHPGEGGAYEQVAAALENEGRLDRADAMWTRAFEVEPTNPTWLLRRAQNLVAAGDAAHASDLLAEIRRGTWQDRFANVTWQAQYLERQLGE
jgi:Flp pilus assembly protein TadD